MRHLPMLMVVCFIVLALSPSTAVPDSDTRLGVNSSRSLGGSFIADEILIGLAAGVVPTITDQALEPDETGIASLDSLNRKYSVQQMSPVFTQIDRTDSIAERHGLTAVFKLTVPAGTDLFAMIAEYQGEPTIAYAEPNRIYNAVDFPNDSDFTKQWALHNTGQTGGMSDADIDAPEAWDVEKGEPTVLIAIVDTGVDYTHPDLAGARVRTDIDKDFFNGDDDAMDDHGHGTYCAGIAAATTNNERGIAGVCQGCQILPVKVLNSSGSGTSETVAQGIQYAGQVGAKIISMSLGYASNCGCSQTVARTINYAFERGSLLIAAAGNDSDKAFLSYPAASPRVMSVGASDHRDQEASFSNRSLELDILAPGVDVYSLGLNGAYDTGSGTSAAAPHVSGAAGLVWSDRAALGNAEVWWILYHSADRTESPTGPEPPPSRLPFITFLPLVLKAYPQPGRLNAHRALVTPAGGAFYAPEDQCSGEPDCPPGCPAEIVLSGNATALDDMRLLRAFRDTVLAESPIGQRWIAFYEQHGLEAALILASHGQVRTEVRLVLNKWLPLFQALTYPDSAAHQQATITSDQAEALEAVIAALSLRGSDQLQSDLEEVRETLQIGRFVGWDVRDAWRELNIQH